MTILNRTNLSSNFFLLLGLLCLLSGLTIAGLTLGPLVYHELTLHLSPPPSNPQISLTPPSSNLPTGKTDLRSQISNLVIPVDLNFSLIIPSLNINTRVVPHVDPHDPTAYQNALTQGVAHAAGTVTPDQLGNTFIFSHSSTNFYTATRYNSIFYLLHKLKPGDPIHLVYQHRLYSYQVTSVHQVEPNNIAYLQQTTPLQTLTLMTCWPPGTNLRRLIVTATSQ